MYIASEPNNTDWAGYIQKRPVVFASIIVLLAVLAALYFSFWKPSIDDTVATNFSEGIRYTDMGDFDSANKYFEEIVNATNDTDIKARAQGHIAFNNFKKFDEESQRKAVRQLKEILMNPDLTNARRAYTLNRLLGLYYFGRDPFVAQEIFDDEPYKSFLVDSNGNFGLAIRKLAELSDKLFPTTFAKLRIAFWYGGALIDNKKLSAETKKVYGKKITDLIKESDELLSNETRLNPVGHQALFWHFRALNAAALYAAGIATTTDDFERSFDEVFKLDTPERSATNKVTVYELTAFTHFYYGGFLSEIFGTSRVDDIRLHADKAVDVVISSEDPTKVPFYLLTIIERDKPSAERDHNYRWFMALASASPKFSKYLSENGWEL